MELAERIAAPQRSSTRTMYKSKWALFEKWCRENLVDFFTPSIKQVSDFYMYLYQDLTGTLRPLMVIGQPLLTLWAQQGSISLRVPTITGCSPVFIGIVPKVPGIFLVSGTFLLFSMVLERHRPQTSYSQGCFLASFGLRQAPQRNPGLQTKYLI